MNKLDKSFKNFIVILISALLLVIAYVWFFDPFYQYHKPFLGMKEVLYDHDNQMPGSIRNLEYENILVGSSVAENFNSDFVGTLYGGKCIKVVRGSAGISDLLYYVEMAEEDHNLKNIVWCLDIFAFTAEDTNMVIGNPTPKYLHTKTFVDDISYIFNKDIIFEKIPYMLVMGKQGKYTDGKAYDWSEDKNFGAEYAMRAYAKTDTVLEPQNYEETMVLVNKNLSNLLLQINEHPEINFTVILPPYSEIYWDCAYVNGELEVKFEILEAIFSQLLKCNNVSLYYFQDMEDIVCDLDNYMDMIHYSPEINQFMLENLNANYEVTLSNYEEKMDSIKTLVDRIINERIFEYYN